MSDTITAERLAELHQDERRPVSDIELNNWWKQNQADDGLCLQDQHRLTNKAWEQACKKRDDKLAEIRAVVDKQADDEGLWFEAVYASEVYLQNALRALHWVIENETPPQ